MSKKGDLFRFFEAINQEDYGYVDSLTDEEIKAMSPYVIQMWMHGASSNTELRVIYNNDYLNDKIFSLQKHPRLLLKLFIAANSGLGYTRFGFVKSVSSAESVIIRQIAQHYACGYDQAKEIKELLSDEDLKEISMIYGEQMK